jgi:mono/diheme cytochrome c family protein
MFLPIHKSTHHTTHEHTPHLDSRAGSHSRIAAQTSSNLVSPSFMPFHLFYSLIALVCLSASVSAAHLERGRTIYSQICFNCHGPKLEGGQGPALKDQYWQHGSSPEAILNVINKGVPGSPMIAFETVFPESDRLALRDFILSEQEGLREVVRSVYPRQFFKNKRFTPALFEGVESDSQTPLPENWYYMDRNADGVMRGTAKLYIREEGDYEFAIRPIGRTSIFLNGDEVHYSDESIPVCTISRSSTRRKSPTATAFTGCSKARSRNSSR